MIFKLPFRVFARVFKNLYFLTFLNGFLISSLLYFHMEASYEEQLFSGIQKNIDKKIDLNDTQDSVVIKIMKTCNNLLGNRASVFIDDADLDGFQTNYLHPASIDLMTAKGACGSYSLVLARILQKYQFQVRIAQMKAHGRFGGHNIIEVKLDEGWVVLDPTFNLFFTRPDNQLASFSDIRNNWAYYSKQLPLGYDPGYKYEDVRYTNWEKVPLLLPAVKKTMAFFIGQEKADTFCMRIFFLKMYDLYFYITLLLLIPVFLYTFKKGVRTKLFPRYDIPFTLGNILKYLKLRFENIYLKKSF